MKSEQQMQKPHATMPLTPILGASSGCLGHILFSARGYRALDRHDRELGTFASAGDAAAAILTAGST